MGSQCCSDEQKLGGGFGTVSKWSQVEMIPWKDDAIEQNFVVT